MMKLDMHCQLNKIVVLNSIHFWGYVIRFLAEGRYLSVSKSVETDCGTIQPPIRSVMWALFLGGEAARA